MTTIRPEEDNNCKFICEQKINYLQKCIIDTRNDFLKIEHKYHELKDMIKKLNYNNG